MTPENSFFCADYKKHRVLVIVPHEDDEILTAGSAIYSLSKLGAEIRIVYTTNGDWKYSAKDRIREALLSAALLGVSEDRVLFMGYGDAVADSRRMHLFYHSDDPVESPAGFRMTYGIEEHQDYAYQRFGVHHSYCASNYLKDIVSVIEQYRPDLIICTDFDEHPDHRMLALYLDKAIGIIKKENPHYSPEILKSFSYALRYTAIPDYSAVNNPETQRPIVGVNKKYAYDIIGKFNYGWEGRVRLPMPPQTRTQDLSANLLAEALSKHRTQCVISRADCIINSDEVYWRRRTDNITFNADLTVSSGIGEYLNDFMLFDVNNIDSPIPEFADFCWKPSKEDKRKSALFKWNAAQTIAKIVLYGALSDDSEINALRIRLSDGTEILTGKIPQNGTPLVVDMGTHTNIEWCEISITECIGEHYGISECEIFSTQECASVIKPYCKIMVKDNFAYEYYVNGEVKEIPVNLYRYGTKEPIGIKVIQGYSFISEGYLHLDSRDKEVVLRAENADGSIYDQAVIKRAKKTDVVFYKKQDDRNREFISAMKRKLKVHNMLYILKRNGIKAVINRTYRNVIRPKLLRRKNGSKQ